MACNTKRMMPKVILEHNISDMHTYIHIHICMHLYLGFSLPMRLENKQCINNKKYTEKAFHFDIAHKDWFSMSKQTFRYLE